MFHNYHNIFKYKDIIYFRTNTLYYPFYFQLSVGKRVLPRAKHATAETLRGENASTARCQVASCAVCVSLHRHYCMTEMRQ